MNTEQYITDAASRGWSRTQTREALGIGAHKFAEILAVMPPLRWPAPGCSHAHRLGHAARRGKQTPQLRAALDKARESRRALHTYEIDGRRGTIDELSAWSPVSGNTIRRRMSEGMTFEQAYRTPQTPVNKRRQGVAINEG